MVDGQEGNRHDLALFPVLSDDGKRLVYIAANAGKVMVVVDSVEARAYDGVLGGTRPVFDGPTHLHMLVRSGPDPDATCV